MCYALKHHQLATTKALVEECGGSLEMRAHVRLDVKVLLHTWYCC